MPHAPVLSASGRCPTNRYARFGMASNLGLRRRAAISEWRPTCPISPKPLRPPSVTSPVVPPAQKTGRQRRTFSTKTNISEHRSLGVRRTNTNTPFKGCSCVRHPVHLQGVACVYGSAVRHTFRRVDAGSASPRFLFLSIGPFKSLHLVNEPCRCGFVGLPTPAFRLSSTFHEPAPATTVGEPLCGAKPDCGGMSGDEPHASAS